MNNQPLARGIRRYLPQPIRQLVESMQTQEGIKLTPHRFGGVEFQLIGKEIGHVHLSGMLDILFSRSIKEKLKAEGKVEDHHYLPETGWTTYYLNREEDVKHGLWLLRLAYWRFAKRNFRSLKNAIPFLTEAEIEQGIRELELSQSLREAL